MAGDFDPGIAEAAARRWVEREAVRQGRVGQTSAEVEPPERVAQRLERLRINAAKATPALSADAPVETLLPAMVHTVGLERVLAEPDFRGIAFLELGLAVSRFVGRVNIKDAFGRTEGYGTGFMVSPRLLLTNNHVLPTADSARSSEIEFDYQFDRYRRPMAIAPFALDPQTFFLTSVGLDFTLVAVAGQSKLGAAIAPYGWSRLIPDLGKALIKEPLNIIQHPRGRMKEIAFRSNELIDLLENFAHYTTDTEPGSSGSPVYNDQWEVVALHHSGVPRSGPDGQLQKADGSPWRAGVDPESELAWVANEGVRVSAIVREIEAAQLDPAQAAMRRELLELEPPDPVIAAQEQGTHRESPRASAGHAMGGEVTFELPLKITVSLGTPGGTRAGGSPVAPFLPDAMVSGRPVVAPTFALPSAIASPEAAAALAELERSEARPYYDAASDDAARERYWQGLDAAEPDPGAFYEALHERLERTHRNRLAYKPARHVYPWVDLRPGGRRRLQSIYSEQVFDAQALIEADFRLDAARERMIAEGIWTPGLEADLPYNCEHVVPQSWFEKREPMRGDLHHLFACEMRCNSFRSNTPYYDFPDFEEAVRDNCGKSDGGRFEPSRGKGAVARATLYFLLRYPGEIGDRAAELPAERLATLIDWHERFPVDEYERHRNAAIEEKQGNRNPLIDFPEWARRIDFGRGFVRRGPGRPREAFAALPPEAMAARLFAVAEQTARAAGVRIRPDAADDLRNCAQTAATEVFAQFGGFASPEAQQRLAEAEAALSATVQLMVVARATVYAGAPERLAAPEVGEETLAWARNKLCPLWPIC